MSAKESNLGRVFFLVLLASVISAAVGAAGFWYVNQTGLRVPRPGKDIAQNPEPPQIPVVALKPIFLELDPFTFTLRSQSASRILYIGLTVQLRDEPSKERLQRYMPVARNRIITELGDIPPEVLNTRETKDAIRRVVARALEAPLGKESQQQQIEDVLINAYVVQ